MTCDKLKMYDISKSGELKEYTVHGRYYLKYEVDALLAEKDKEIESLKASHYAEMVDAGMRERRLRRALWLARANRAHAEAKYNHQTARRYEEHKEHTIADCFDATVNKWQEVDHKCRAKAEEYK